MNRFVQSLIFCGVLAAFIGCNQQPEAQQKSGPVQLVTTADSVSYLIGKDISRSLKDVKEEVVLDILFKGVTDHLAGTEVKIESEAERTLMQAFQMKMQQKSKKSR